MITENKKKSEKHPENHEEVHTPVKIEKRVKKRNIKSQTKTWKLDTSQSHLCRIIGNEYGIAFHL